MNTLSTLHTRAQASNDAYIKSFNDDIEKVFKKVSTLTIANLKGITINDVLSYELYFRKSLQKAGYYRLVNNLIDTQFNHIAAGTSDMFKAGGLKSAFTKENLAQLKVLKDMKRNLFTRIGDDAGLAVKRELYKYVISDSSLSVMANGIADHLPNTNLVRYSNTYARTAIGEFQQDVIDVRAQDMDGVWIYVGVADDRTRDYCNEVLADGRYYDDTEKADVENNPERAYNCRHRLYAVSLEYAKEEGYV